MEASELLGWIMVNKEWLFSGVGVFALGGVFALMRRRSPEHASGATVASASVTSSQPSQALEPKRTTSIPIMTQKTSVVLGKHPNFPPLVFSGEVCAFAEVSIDWRVLNPLQFMNHANDEHPMDPLVLKLVGNLRLMLEEQSIQEARRLRSEIAAKARENLAPLFKERGIVLEAVDIGALLPFRI